MKKTLTQVIKETENRIEILEERVNSYREDISEVLLRNATLSGQEVDSQVKTLIERLTGLNEKLNKVNNDLRVEKEVLNALTFAVNA